VAPPDPRAIADRIRVETGIDLFDPAADAVAAAVAMRRAVRQVMGTIGCSGCGGLASILLVLGFIPRHPGPGAGVRVALVVFGGAVVAGAVMLGIWGWRLPAAYREVFLPREAARRRFLAEIGQLRNPLGAADWLGRKALIAYSTPAEVREMRAAEREATARQAPPGDDLAGPSDPRPGP
jgi:hypothetical protein